MKQDELTKALGIRYVDLKFTLALSETCTLPVNKASALRGGMGQMLLKQNCIGDRNCDGCGFADECLVRRMMYSKFEIQPEFAIKGDSIGYVIRCGDRRTSFAAGEQFTFHLLLYGKTIAYFSQFLQAFHTLGQYGLGKQHGRFEIVQVENGRGKIVVDGFNVYLQQLGIETIWEYVQRRMHHMVVNGCENRIEFRTPVTIKYKGEFIKAFHEEAFFHSLLRRIYSFDCFEGIGVPLMTVADAFPEIIEQEAKFASVPRYSTSAEAKMFLKGIYGYMVFDHLSEMLMMLVLAGEKLQIGKNTSFGFGMYRLK